MRRWILLAGVLLLPVTRAAAQEAPRIEVDLRATDADPPRAAVRLHDLLADDRFVAAMRSGFPLYVALTVDLREERSLWDRTVDRWVWEYVVVHDPVRDVFVLEDPDGTEEIADRDALARAVSRVYLVGLPSSKPGRFHYQASATARMLSDEDVDEVYAWLRGDDTRGTRRDRPGLLTRAARKVLVQVAPLPRVTLESRTEGFDVRADEGR
jgi:hypothetical protein